MKHWLLITLLGLPVHAQDQSVIIEDGQGDIAHEVQPGEVCRRVNQEVVCTQVYQPEPTPPPVQMYQAWSSLAPTPEPRPTIDNKYCPRTQEYALAGFVANMHTANINKVVESYYWKGVRNEDAEYILAALSAIPIDGEWQRSVWMDGMGGVRRQARGLRWQPHDRTKSATSFVLKQDEGCWFVQLAQWRPTRPASPIEQEIQGWVEDVAQDPSTTVLDGTLPSPSLPPPLQGQDHDVATQEESESTESNATQDDQVIIY